MLKRLLLIGIYTILCLCCSVAFARDIRVGLVEKQATVELSCDDEFVVQDGDKESILPRGKYFVHIKDGKLFFDDKLAFNSGIAIRRTEGKQLPLVNQRAYKGSLQVLTRHERLTVVNRVELEAYLASVLPAKTMVVWPDEAVKAQAVAARTYAMYMAEQNSAKDFDLNANDVELTYHGTGKNIERPSITRLIMATAGQHLVDSAGQLIKAVSTSSSGGRTESAINLWGQNLNYLQSVDDYDSDSPDGKWEYKATPAFVETLLAQRGYVTGKLNSVRLSPLDEKGIDRSPTGRVRYLIFAGEAGVARVSGQELAEILGLSSLLFDIETGTPPPETLKVPIENYYGMEIGSKDIDIKLQEESKPVWKNLLRSYHMLSGGREEKIIFRGSGRGSGVGLSAWGARGMANASDKNTYLTILQHYYIETHLVK